jgi:hypothetical protein
LKATTNSTTYYYLIIVDMVSMYTNMLKEEVLANIGELLNEIFIFVSPNFPIEEILAAIEIILDNNIFTFRDTF